MKIGMILDQYFPPDPRVENEISSLLEEGHEVYLYSQTFDASEKLEEVIYGITVFRFPISKLTYKLSALAYTIPFYHKRISKGIKQFIQKYEVDSLHIHDIRSARAVFDVNKEFKLPITLDLHENRPEIMRHYDYIKAFPGRILIKPDTWKKYEYKYIKQADHVIVVTDAATEYYTNEIKVPSSKFCTTPNTVRQAFINSNITNPELLLRYNENFTLLYMGDTGLRRGLETTIKALKLVIKVIPNIKLVIVGKSKTDHVLTDLVASLSLEEYVDFEGWQDFKLFPSYIKSCDIGLCPIHKNIHHETTFANKVFQYMAFSKPIIVSDCKAQQDVVDEFNCGLVFKDQDQEDMAEKILSIYKNTELRANLGTNAKKAIEVKYNWESSSKPLKELYKTIERNSHYN